MSQSVNKVTLIGRLGISPDVHFTSAGRAVCNLRIATDESWKDKDGVLQKRTEWHRVTVWGTRAENCGKYLTKGRLVMVEGKLQTRSWEKDEVKHYVTEIVASNVQFLDKAPEGAKQAQPETQNDTAAQTDIPY